uniref:Ectonucleotide pyrophosphatase/phosphodiesterase 7 n=1 Tax=Sinocyclocheilus grahami TaxID=75366 RepID=A0A672N9Z1_SINGR
MLLALSVLLLIFPANLSAPTRDLCTKGKDKLLLTIFDGFRWDYDRDVDTPNLDKMAEEGVKAAYVTPPYPTITSPTHFTLLSGKEKRQR